MDINRLQQQIANTRHALFAEKHLNQNFAMLEVMGGQNPEFIAAILDQYFADADMMISRVEEELEKEPLDFIAQENFLFSLKSKCASVGANNVMRRVELLSSRLKGGRSTKRCKDAFQLLKRELEIFKKKMQFYFQMMRWDPPEEIEDQLEYYDDDSDEEMVVTTSCATNKSQK